MLVVTLALPVRKAIDDEDDDNDTVRRGSFLIVLVVVVALALPVRKAIDDDNDMVRRGSLLDRPRGRRPRSAAEVGQGDAILLQVRRSLAAHLQSAVVTGLIIYSLSKNVETIRTVVTVTPSTSVRAIGMS